MVVNGFCHFFVTDLSGHEKLMGQWVIWLQSGPFNMLSHKPYY